jgi:hypothetical protein
VGVKNAQIQLVFPLPSIPSHQGRGSFGWKLLNLDGFPLAYTVTDTALNTPFTVDHMGFLFFAGNGFLRTLELTEGATVTTLLVNNIFKEVFAYPGRALFIKYMGLIFIPEVPNGAEYRIGSGPSQGTQRGRRHNTGKIA